MCVCVCVCDTNVMRTQVFVCVCGHSVFGVIYNGFERGSTNQNQGPELSVL